MHQLVVKTILRDNEMLSGCLLISSAYQSVLFASTIHFLVCISDHASWQVLFESRANPVAEVVVLLEDWQSLIAIDLCRQKYLAKCLPSTSMYCPIKLMKTLFYLLPSLLASLSFVFSVKMFCDFEKDLCSWRHETRYTNGLKWHHSEPDPCNKSFCPFQPDRYLFVTSSDLALNNSFVRIAHYPLNAQVSGDCSLTMKYIARGVGFAKLIVGIRTIGYREPEPVLVVHSSRRSDWYQVKIPLIASYVFTPVIEAVKNSDYTEERPTDGFIAIDDVSLSEGCLTREDAYLVEELPYSNTSVTSQVDFGDPSEDEDREISEENFDPNNDLNQLLAKSLIESDQDYPQNLTSDYTSLPKQLANQKCEDGTFCQKNRPSCSRLDNSCDFKKDCDDGSDELACPSTCDLDDVHDQEQFKQLCGWSQSRAGTRFGTWILISPIYASKYFEKFPKVDATKSSSSGKYLILNVINSTKMPSIHLNSPTFRLSQNTCFFTFSYIIYDRSAVFYITLTVEPEKSVGRGTSVSLLWKSNILATRASKWRNASAYIGPQSDPFFLTFVRSSAPYSAHGTVALDNMKFNACWPGNDVMSKLHADQSLGSGVWVE